MDTAGRDDLDGIVQRTEFVPIRALLDEVTDVAPSAGSDASVIELAMRLTRAMAPDEG